MLDDRFERTGREIQISVNGEDILAIEGETVAAALAADGRVAYGEGQDAGMRGPFCGMGVCHDCLVAIDGGPSCRACMTKVCANMRIRTLGFRARVPSAMPVAAPEPAGEPLGCDVLIVGAGPAGLAAAECLAQTHLHTRVIDERSEPGGQYFKQLAGSHGFADGQPTDSQYGHGKALIERVGASGVELHCGVTVWSAARDCDGAIEVAIIAEGKSSTIRPKQLILATGAYERAVPFPGWTLPGVMTTGAAQGLARAHRVAPGQRMLIAGNGPLNLQAACELTAGGIDVVAVAELAPKPWPGRITAALQAGASAPGLLWQGLRYLRQLRQANVPLLHAHVVLRAEGDQRVRRVTVAGVDSQGHPQRQTERAFDVDALCIGYGFLPSNGLARLLDCEHTNAAPGVLTPQRGADGRTTIPDVYVVGDGGVFGGAHVALAEGRLAARAVLRRLERRPGAGTQDGRRLNRHRRFQKALWALYSAPAPGIKLADASTLLCRCEAVPRSNIEALVRNGTVDLGSLKRLTRAGMGRCQGRYCTPLLAELIAQHTGCAPEPRSLFMPQRPLLPVPAGTVAVEQPEWRGYRAVSLPPVSEVPSSDKIALDTDVLIIGGGVIGISTAYFAAREGLDVCVVERGVVNSQASGGNAGTLHLQLLSFEFRDENERADSPAISAVPLHRDGIALWQSLERDLDADFELSITGGIMVAENETDLAFLRAKAAVERRQGIAAELLTRDELRARVPGVSNVMIGGVLCEGEGKINPLTATSALLGAARDAGVRVIERTPVTAIARERAGFAVATAAGTIRCRRIVNAAGAWTPEVARLAGIELPVRSAPQQMIVTEPMEPIISHVLAHAHRHLTMKQAVNGNLIIGGGWFADYAHTFGRPVTAHDSILGNLWAACAVLPAVAGVNVIRSWAALGVAIDGAPIIGEAPGHPGLIHAVSANGYTLGPIIGRTVAEQLKIGRAASEAAPFTLARFA